MEPDPADWRQPKKERRLLHRVPASEHAALLSSALGRVDAELLDLSQTGCRIRSRVCCRRGDRFVLRIDSFGPRAVTTAWQQGDSIGVAFVEPLAWAVVAMIAARSAAAAAGAISGG